MIPKVLWKVLKEKVLMMILVTPDHDNCGTQKQIQISTQQPAFNQNSSRPKQNFKINDIDGLKARLQKEEIARKTSSLSLI